MISLARPDILLISKAMKTVKTIAAAALALVFGGCVPTPTHSRTLNLQTATSELVEIPEIRLVDLSAGVRSVGASYVHMYIAGCGHTETFRAINKNDAYGFDRLFEQRDFSRQLYFHGTDFGNETDGWRVFVLREEFKRSMIGAMAAGCNVSDMTVVYTVHASEYTAFRPETTDKSYEVVVNEHVL